MLWGKQDSAQEALGAGSLAAPGGGPQRTGAAQCLCERVAAWDGWGKILQNEDEQELSSRAGGGHGRVSAQCGCDSGARCVAAETKALANKLQRGGGGGCPGAQCRATHLRRPNSHGAVRSVPPSGQRPLRREGARGGCSVPGMRRDVPCCLVPLPSTTGCRWLCALSQGAASPSPVRGRAEGQRIPRSIPRRALLAQRGAVLSLAGPGRGAHMMVQEDSGFRMWQVQAAPQYWRKVW